MVTMLGGCNCYECRFNTANKCDLDSIEMNDSGYCQEFEDCQEFEEEFEDCQEFEEEEEE